MAEIINLRRARKAQARAAKEAEAATNRARHGRPKAERLLEEARAAKAAADLDARRRSKPARSGDADERVRPHKAGPDGTQ